VRSNSMDPRSAPDRVRAKCFKGLTK
jgi:hypothetical protein